MTVYRKGSHQRNLSIELLRLVAAFGVVVIHVRSNTNAAEAFGKFFLPFCVPFFFIVSLLFFSRSLQGDKPVTEVLMRSGKRLVFPYLVWTVIYTSLILLKSIVSSSDHSFVWWRILLYGESSVQLYFLPQLFSMQIALLGAFLLQKRSFWKKTSGVLFILSASLYWYYGHLNDCFGVQSLLNIIVYLIFPFVLSRLEDSVVRGKLSSYLGMILVVAAAIFHFSERQSDFGVITSIPIGGMGLAMLAVGRKDLDLPRWLIDLASVSFGVYLSHIVFLEMLELVFDRFTEIDVHYNLLVKIGVSMFVFILAAMFTQITRKVPLGRRLLLGEVR